MKHEPENPLCPYCGARSAYIESSAEVYHGRDYGPLYICRPCQAWVGVHKGTTKPLGRLADATLRTAKQRVHAAFDPLWVQYWRAYTHTEERSSGMRVAQRLRCYAWLADELGIPVAECHIGMFDVALCALASDIIMKRRPDPAYIRQWWKSREGAQAPKPLPPGRATPNPDAPPPPWDP